MTHHEHNGSIATSVITAFIALIPDYAISYAGKLASVFVLAVVAELGRRIVKHFWHEKPE